MKLRAYVNRCVTGNLNGALLRHPAKMPEPMALCLTTPAAAWFQPRDTWPNGQIRVVDLEQPDELLDWDVVGHAGADPAVYDGDLVLVDTSAYGHAPPGEHWCRVVRVSEGTASVYPLTVVLVNGSQGEMQFKASEIKGVRRNADPEEDSDPDTWRAS